MTKRRISDDWVRERLASLSPSTSLPLGGGESASGYVRAAAALDVFNQDIRPLEGDPSKKGFHDLLNCSRVARLPDGPLVWRLSDDQRRQVLRTMTLDDVRKAISKNPDRIVTATQRMLDTLVEGGKVDLATADLLQLAALQRVSRWFQHILPSLPTEAEMEARLDYLRLIDPFIELTKTGFHGRSHEIAEIRDYIGWSARRSKVSKVASWIVEDVFSFEEKPPLVIHGPGGIGKSTLLAKLILEHNFEERINPLPFVYLNFESPEILTDEPLTIIVVASRQLGVQLPDGREAAEAVVEQTLSVIRSTSYGGELESLRGQHRQSSRLECVERFRELVTTYTQPAVPMLFVLDTFEKVQGVNPDWVEKLWALLEDLQEKLPKLRVIVGGRRPIDDLRSRNLALGEMDVDAALRFLSEIVPREWNLGDDDYRKIYGVTGGNPLSLKLAASALERLDVDSALKGIRTRHWYLLPVKDAQVQGQLYRRILDHIEDPDIRKLAHPGLVLRRITPRVIKAVLADVCELDIPTMDQARDLFEKFEHYAELVYREIDGSLRHREDVRRVMLPALKADQPERVERIHRLAVDYYTERSDETGDPALRTEELYHRMAIGEDSSVLDERWVPEARDGLANFEDEITPSSRAFYRSRLRLPIDDELLAHAETEIWEREAVRRAEAHQAHLRLEDALNALRERAERSGYPRIVRLEVELLEQLGRPEEGDEVFATGLAAALQHADLGNYVELGLARIRRLESHDDLEEALRAIAEFRQIAAESLSDDTQLELDLTELRIGRKLETEVGERPQIERRAVQRYLALSDAALADNLDLSVQAAAELGTEPLVLAKALEVAPPAPLGDFRDLLSKYTVADDGKAEEKTLLSDPKLIQALIDPSADSLRRRVSERLVKLDIDQQSVDALVGLYRLST